MIQYISYNKGKIYNQCYVFYNWDTFYFLPTQKGTRIHIVGCVLGILCPKPVSASTFPKPNCIPVKTSLMYTLLYTTLLLYYRRLRQQTKY